MEIERKKKGVKFGTLNNGDCFEWDESFFMKTAIVMRANKTFLNAVYLQYGTITFFDDEELVKPVKLKAVEE